MKVLQLINSMGTGGAEKLLLETIPLYRKRGIDMDLLVLDGSVHPFMKALQQRTDCKIFVAGSGSIYNPLRIFWLMKFMRQYDVVHVHLFPSLYWAALAKWLSLARTRLVYTEHSTGNRRRSNPLMRLADKIFYGAYDRIVCISQEVQNALQRHLQFKSAPFTVIPNGVNLSEIEAAVPYSVQEFPIRNHSVVLIQVSRFEYPKDQATVIRAMPLLAEEIVLVLIGEGTFYEENQTLANELGVAHRVYFLGTRMDVPRLLKTSDIVLLSSRHEGVSLSSIEAMASGNPFVASDAPGLAEMVDGAGLLFPAGDEKELARIITDLAAHPLRRDALAESGRKRAGQYDINDMVLSHIALYQSLTAKKTV